MVPLSTEQERGFFMATRGHMINSEVAEIVHKELNGSVSLHWHNYCECEILFGGVFDYTINDRKHRLVAPCAYIATPKDTHSLEILSETPVEIFSLSFDESYIDSAVVERFSTTEKVACFTETEAEGLRFLLLMLADEYGRLAPLRENMLHTLITTALIYIMRSMGDGRSNNKEPDRLIMQVVAIIHARFREKLTVKLIAEAIYMTPNYIGEVFKTKMGVSINNYLMETRLTYARNLLVSKKLNIKELAYQSGFGSATHFSSSFKKRYGISPSEYVQSLSEKA